MLDFTIKKTTGLATRKLRVLLTTQPQASAAQSAPGVPEGWRLVPVEPTPKMMRAGVLESVGALRVYYAMLAAAPAQPAAHVSVPRELLEWIESHLDRTTFAPFGEPLPPDNTERRELRDRIRALLNGGEA